MGPPGPGAPVPIHSVKYDGSLHYRWTPGAVDARLDVAAVYLPPGGWFESHRGRFAAEHHYLFICWMGFDLNLLVSWHPDWTPREHYVNVVSDARWAGGVIRYVDLDVDIILRHGASGPVLDDVDELHANVDRFGYPPHLVERCLAQAESVRAALAGRAGIFDGRLYEWRPGRPLPPGVAEREGIPE